MSIHLAGRHIPRESPASPAVGTSWAALQAEAHRPEIQVLIRRAIVAGAIRVRPDADGGLRIIPNRDDPPGGPGRRRGG